MLFPKVYQQNFEWSCFISVGKKRVAYCIFAIVLNYSLSWKPPRIQDPTFNYTQQWTAKGSNLLYFNFNAAISFSCYKVKKTMDINKKNKPTFQACFEYVREDSNITLKNPLCFPIRGLLWDCFFTPRNDLKKLQTATLRSVWCHKLLHFSTCHFQWQRLTYFQCNVLFPSHCFH